MPRLGPLLFCFCFSFCWCLKWSVVSLRVCYMIAFLAWPVWSCHPTQVWSGDQQTQQEQVSVGGRWSTRRHRLRAVWPWLTGGGGDGAVSVARGADKVKAFVSGRWAEEHALGNSNASEHKSEQNKGVVCRGRTGTQIRIKWGHNSAHIQRPCLCFRLLIIKPCLLDVTDSSVVPPGHSLGAWCPSEFITLIDPAAVNTPVDVLEFHSASAEISSPMPPRWCCFNQQNLLFTSPKVDKHRFPSWFSKKINRKLALQNTMLSGVRKGICFGVSSHLCTEAHTHVRMAFS